MNQASRIALGEISAVTLGKPLHRLGFGEIEIELPEGMERIIMPQSKGLLLRSSEEFRVLRIVQMPGGLSYEGIPSSLEGSGGATMALLMDVADIPGESQPGCYDPATGKIEPLAESTLGFFASEDEEKTVVNPDLLATIARVAVWGFGIVVAVNQIGVAQTLVNTLFMGLVGAVALAAGLAFGLGPFLAFAASLLSQELLNGRLWGLLTSPLAPPWNFVAVFGGAAPLMIAAGALAPLLVIPSDEVDFVHERGDFNRMLLLIQGKLLALGHEVKPLAHR